MRVHLNLCFGCSLDGNEAENDALRSTCHLNNVDNLSHCHHQNTPLDLHALNATFPFSSCSAPKKREKQKWNQHLLSLPITHSLRVIYTARGMSPQNTASLVVSHLLWLQFKERLQSWHDYKVPKHKARRCSETHSIFISSPRRDMHSSSSFSGRPVYWSLQAASFREAAQQFQSHLPDVLITSGNNYTPKSSTCHFYSLLPSDPSRIHFLCLCWKSSSFLSTFPLFPPNWQATRTYFFTLVTTTDKKSRETEVSIGQRATFHRVCVSWAWQCHYTHLGMGSKLLRSQQCNLAGLVDLKWGATLQAGLCSLHCCSGNRPAL